jgi:HK97 family phage major capsid protein/HK97 family phage prohead protease
MADLPRDNLVRAVFPADLEIRAENGDSPTLHGHFAVFNTFTEIKSMFEGNFLERIAPGAFAKTIKENAANMRVLFQHGRDPQIGDKVLGVPTVLEEDKVGARYEVPLFDTTYNHDLEPGLRAGAYGASFRFQVVKEEIDQDPKRSAYNQEGLPERTILEARVMEFGPVTFPAYADATAGVRSLTDDFLPGGRFAQGPDGHAERTIGPDDAQDVTDESPGTESERDTEVAPASEEPSTTVEEEPTHSQEEASRDTQPSDERRATTDKQMEDVMDSIEEMRARQDEIRREQETMATENRGRVLSAQDQARWDQFDAEWEDLENRCAAENARAERLLRYASQEGNRESTDLSVIPTSGTGTYVTRRPGRDQTPENVFDLAGYHGLARDQDHMMRLIGDGARRAIETFNYPHPKANKEEVNAHIEQVLRLDSPDKEIAQRILGTGSELYHRSFWKHITGQSLTNEEQRALVVGAGASGLATGAGVAVPVDLDPTLIPTSNQALNPIRALSRVVTTTSYTWMGVTSGGVVAQYQAENAVAIDNSPTLTQPQITPERVTSFVPFSYELGQDWGGLEASLASEIQDAKDVLEATKFTNGAGHSSNEPQGVITGGTSGGFVGSDSVSGTAGRFTADSVYALERALPARHLASSAFVSSIGMFQKVRQLDTAGGANLWVQLQSENPPELIGYPAYKATNVGTAPAVALTSGAIWSVFGNWSRYVIVDRIGMSVRVIPDLFGGTAAVHYPTGQSGLWAFWRNSAGVVDSNAFRVGTIS